MIVPMKKVSVVVLDAFREQSLEKLREVGMLHLESTDATSGALTDLQEKRDRLEQAIRLLPTATDTAEGTGTFTALLPVDTATKIIKLAEKRQLAIEETSRLEREADRLSQWGDFDPADVIALREKGIDIRLYRLTRKQMEEIPEETRIFVLNETKSAADLAVVSTGGPADLPFEEMPLPELGLSGVRKAIGEKNAETAEIRRELAELSAARSQLEAAVGELDSGIEFEGARAGMGLEEKLAFLVGYAPERAVEDLKKAASENGWGLLVEDPGEEDPVPTLIENHKWIRIIQPIFGILGTVPGYREQDISFWFLLFFSFFYAIIIGDAAYGLIFLAGTFIVRKKFPKAPSEPFTLLYALSVATIIWGAFTGTWFGSKVLAQSAALSWAVYPKLASFAENAKESQLFWMHMCFVIGVVHLTIAHLKNFARLFPDLRGYAEIGWITIIWGMYFVILKFVLKRPLSPACPVLLAAGLIAVTVFAEQEGRFLRGLAVGLAKLPLNVFSGIGCFSDVVSYVRLFAVSLAALEVSKSFNGMASNVGFGIPAVFGAVLILLFGHTLNIVLGAMSVIVHGVRLNMLEYSSHLKMEWSGIAYRPFRAR